MFLPTTEEACVADEDAPATTRRKAKGTSGKLRTADTAVVKQITWCYLVIYTCSGEPATHENLDSMNFVNGYLTVMAMEPVHIKAKMLSHLQELTEDGVAYGWQAVRLYQTAWLQHVEQA